MTSLTGLVSGDFTDIDVVDTIRINGDSGSNNQVLTSDGTFTSYQDPTAPPVADILTAGTGITITSTGNPETIATNVKSLILDGTAVSGAPITFNPNANGGDQTITINDTDTQLNLTAGAGINITTIGGSLNKLVSAKIDSDTLVFNAGDSITTEVAKVPNALTAGTNISFSSGSTYDGSSAITISSTDTNTQLNLTADLPMVIDSSAGGLNKNVELNFDNNTMGSGGGALEVLKVPNALTAGTNISFSSGSTYDGSSAITISSTDTDTTYQGGKNITVDTTTNPDTINLDDSLTNIDSITFTSTAGSTALTGNDYPQNPTPMTNFNLTDTSNIISPYFFHDAYDPSSLDSDSLSTSYANIFSSNLFNSFTAQQTSCAIELRVYNAQTSSFGRSTFARLNGSSSTSSTAEFTTFYSTGGRDTTRTIHQADESDDVYLTMTWVLTGLTIGNSYNLYPQMRSTSSSGNFIRAGGSNAPAILRGYYLPATGG